MTRTLSAQRPFIFAILLVASSAAAGCTEGPIPPPVTPTTLSPATPPAVEPPRDQLVVLETSAGVVVLDIYLDLTPLTGRNFLDLSAGGTYDGTRFHRVIGPEKMPPAGFMIQGGDPLTADTDNSDRWGQGGSNQTVPDEFPRTANGSLALPFDEAGLLAMANSGANTSSSQFFITLQPTPWLDGKHTVFGRVIAGMDVVRSIATVPTDAADRPLADVFLYRATPVNASAWR